MKVQEARLGRLHWPMVLVVALIAGLGVWNLASAGELEGGEVWLAQLRALGVGAFLVALLLTVDYRWIRSLAWPVYLATLVMLILVPYKGRVIMGAQRWLELGPLRLQPSEFAKFAVMLMLARHFGDRAPETRSVARGGLLGRLRWGLQRWWSVIAARLQGRLAPAPLPARPHAASRVTGFRLPDLIIPGIYLLLPVVLVIKQPDLGTGLVTTAIGGSMILFAGLTGRTLLTLATTGIGGALLAWFFALKPYQKDRLITFQDPEKYALGKGYHAIQSLIAVGSGRVWGKGWGEGTQNQLRFLPEQHTDFAFPVWAEEHGLVGSVVMVVLFLVLVLMAMEVAATARDRFGAFLAFGAAALFFWHAVINIGMVTGLLPVVGVPLLLVSYGGSSAVLTLLAVGALLSVRMRRNTY